MQTRLRIPMMCACAIALMTATPALASDPCEVQGPLAVHNGPDAARTQGDVQLSTIAAIESALAGQFGGTWYEDEGQALAVGLTTGALTHAGAVEAVDAAIAGHVPAGEVAYVEANTQVLSVSYSPGELASAQARIADELLGALPGEAFAVGQTVGEFAGTDSAGYWPQVSVQLNDLASEAQCRAALTILEPYGAMASLRRTAEGPAVAIDERVVPPPSGKTEPPSSAEATKLSLTGAVRDKIVHLHMTFTRAASGRMRISVRRLHPTRSSHSLVRTIAVDAARQSTVAIRLPAALARSAARLRVSATLTYPGQPEPVAAKAITVALAR